MFAATRGGGTPLDPNAAFFIGSATGTTSISLTGLGLQQNDLVIVSTGWTDTTGTPGATGYTQSTSVSKTGNVTVKHYVGYKVMGATPDSSITLTASPSGAAGTNSIAYAWRRINSTTPLDTSSTWATGTYPDSVNSPAITHSGNCIILSIGFLGHTGSGTISGAPSGMSNFVVQSNSTLLSYNALASAYVAGSPYDPAAFTTGFGGNETWIAVTMALKLA